MISNILHWLRELIDFLVTVLNGFASFCSGIIEDVTVILVRCYVAVFNAVSERFLRVVFDLLDDSMDSVSGLEYQRHISQLFYVADTFFDLKAGFAILSGFLIFVGVFIGVKFFLKLIPGIG